jgi:hypothetical protein
LRLPFNEIAIANMAPKNIGTPRKGNLCRAALVVVVTVTVNGRVGVAGVSVTEAGLMEQVVPAGAPEHANVTVPLKVAGPFTLVPAATRL